LRSTTSIEGGARIILRRNRRDARRREPHRHQAGPSLDNALAFACRHA
jgi:hypothetical protein